MKYLNLISILILGVTFSTIADTIPKGTQPGIFIGAVKVQPAVIEAAKSNDSAKDLHKAVQALETQFISALSATRVFKIVERKRKSEVEQEQGYASVAVDVNDSNAAQMGKMAGAKYVLLPEVDAFEEMTDAQQYTQIKRISVRKRFYISVTVSIVDTTTGALLPDVPSVQLTQDVETDNSRQATAVVQGTYITVIELAKKAANQLCQQSVAFLRPAKILAVNGKRIMINRGTAAGFNKGIKVQFFAIQKIKDEDSGEVFNNEVPVGSGIITMANPKQSYAEINTADNNLGVAAGCTVKPDLKSTARPTASIPESAPGGAFPKNPDKIKQTAAPTTAGSSEKPINFNQ